MYGGSGGDLQVWVQYTNSPEADRFGLSWQSRSLGPAEMTAFRVRFVTTFPPIRTIAPSPEHTSTAQASLSPRCPGDWVTASTRPGGDFDVFWCGLSTTQEGGYDVMRRVKGSLDSTDLLELWRDLQLSSTVVAESCLSVLVEIEVRNTNPGLAGRVDVGFWSNLSIGVARDKAR
jgi:hypothetical protein